MSFNGSAFGAAKTLISQYASGYDHSTKTGDNTFDIYFTDGSKISITIPGISTSDLDAIFNARVYVTDEEPSSTDNFVLAIEDDGEDEDAEEYLTKSEVEDYIDTEIDGVKSELVVKEYLIKTSDNNVFDASTIKDNTALASSGTCAESTNTAYFVSDFIEVPIGATKFYIINALAYKVLMIDANGNFIAHAMGGSVTEVDLRSSAVYVRVQFKKTTTPISNVNNIKMAFDSATIVSTKQLTTDLKVSESSCNWHEPNREFSYYGEKINLNNTLSFSRVYKNLATQSACVYGDYLVSFNSSSTFYVLNTKTHVLSTCVLSGNVVPHCNTAVFGNEFYSESDAFPLVYINAYNNDDLPKGTVYVYRITGNDTDGYTSELVQTITIGFTTDALWTDGVSDERPYGNFIIDTNKNMLVAFTTLDTTNVTRFFYFDLPTLADGTNITLAKTDIKSRFDVAHISRLQDATFHNGKIYVNSGTSTETFKMSVINPILEKIVTVINYADCGMNYEPEGLTILNGKLLTCFQSLGFYYIEV